MLFDYVVKEIFKHFKFTFGNDEDEKELCQIAIDEGYVKIKDPRIPHGTFIKVFYKKIATGITDLRRRTRGTARKKFRSKLICGLLFAVLVL